MIRKLQEQKIYDYLDGCGTKERKNAENKIIKKVNNLIDEVNNLKEKSIPKQVIKTETSSQACPVCQNSVNWKYCSNCGQALKY